jgi:hypothetical protein
MIEAGGKTASYGGHKSCIVYQKQKNPDMSGFFEPG